MSEYSYDQYHWWPIALIVIRGDFTSSIRYRIRNEGRAKNTSVIAGRTVQIVSTVWAENLSEFRYLLFIKDRALTPTIVRIRVTMNKVWS